MSCVPADSNAVHFVRRMSLLLAVGACQEANVTLVVEIRTASNELARYRLFCPVLDGLSAAAANDPCRKGRYAPPVHMIKLTETREITPYLWVHPDEER
jgi:hypothetical protein